MPTEIAMALSVSYYFRVMPFFFIFEGLFYVHSVANSMERMSQGKGNACQVAAIMENGVSNGDTGGLKCD